TASPSAFSMRSRKTSTSSPTFRPAASRPGPANSFMGTRPSVFRPMSMTAMSFSIATTLPLTTEPSCISERPEDSSSRAAKSSRVGWVEVAVAGIQAPITAKRARAVPHPLSSCAADDLQDLPECRLYIQVGGIEQDSIRRGFQGCRGPFDVALVAPADVGQHLLIGNRFPPARKLAEAAGGADLGARSDENLDLRLGRDDGSGVAAVEYGAAGAAGEVLLELQERGADLRHDGDLGGRLAQLRARQALAVEIGEIDR